MLASIKTLDIVKSLFLSAALANMHVCATAATVKFVAEGQGLAKARMIEVERKGSAYVGQHLIGFVGDSLELEKGLHHISLDAPNFYIFDFSITVGDKNVTVSDISIRQQNCKPELKAAWGGPTVTSNKHGTHTLILPTPKFGPPTGEGVCASPAIVPCERRSVSLDIQSSPKGAEIWINAKKQPSRTNGIVKTDLELCRDDVDVLLRLPGKANCSKKISASGPAPAKVTCAFSEGVQQR